MKKFFLFLLCYLTNIPVFALSDFAGYGITNHPLALASQACYASKISNYSSWSNITDGLSYFEFELFLQISEEEPFKYGSNFAAYFNALAKNTLYFLQYNRVFIVGNDTWLQFSGAYLDALNEVGKKIYTTQKDQFDSKCGGDALVQYLTGSFTTAALIINFSKPNEAEDYRGKTLYDDRSLLGRIQNLQTLASRYSYSGNVTVQAIQLGGIPSALATTGLKANEKGYYELTCSLSDMQKCVNAASNYYDYLTQDYPTQISTKDNKGLIPLLINFHSIPKRYLGL